MSNYKAALVRISEYPPEIAISADGYSWYVAGPRLGSQHGWYADADCIEIIRPLVVLDFQATGLDPAVAVREIREVLSADSFGWPRIADQIEQQTRPQKPPEPTGLGAVVEDAAGQKWVLTNPSGAAQWIEEDAGARARLGYRRYADIDAVRVLSEGVRHD